MANRSTERGIGSSQSSREGPCRGSFVGGEAFHADLSPAFPNQEIDLGVLSHADPLFVAQVDEQA